MRTTQIINLQQLNLVTERKSKLAKPLEVKIFKKPEENRKYSAIINTHYRNCGCYTGKLFLASAMPICLLRLAFISKTNFMDNKLFYAAQCIFIVLLMSFFGKLLGKYISRIKLKKIIREITLKINDQGKAEHLFTK